VFLLAFGLVSGYNIDNCTVKARRPVEETDGPLIRHTPYIEQVLIERLREMRVWRKLALMADKRETMRTLALAGLRDRYPDDTPAQRKRRLADLLPRKQTCETASQATWPSSPSPWL
jgi:hypothetical protein